MKFSFSFLKFCSENQYRVSVNLITYKKHLPSKRLPAGISVIVSGTKIGIFSKSVNLLTVPQIYPVHTSMDKHFNLNLKSPDVKKAFEIASVGTGCLVT